MTMSDMKTQRLSDAVTLHTFTDSSFKTMKVSVHMLVPLTRESAAPNGILPSLVSRATREYPDFTALNCRLAELYGASLYNSVRKMGEYQVLTLSAGGLSSRYAFGGEDMFAQLTDLLFSVIFHPLKDEEGLFPLDGFRQEQRQILELKDAEFSDKIAYAHQRCEELLFQGETAGINRYGSREEVEALDRRVVTNAWEKLLSSAKFEIFVLGDCVPDPAAFRDRFSSLGSPQPTGLLPYKKPLELRRLTEEQPLAQSKLSMAFRLDCAPKERLLFQLMSAVLGGVPSSKLFQNVREKMSLCYYCSSGLEFNSRTLYIESGVETDNLERAEEAIHCQIQALQKGELTEEELLSAKLALKNSLRSVGDSLPAVENWYLNQSFSGQEISPDAAVEKLMGYTAEDVVEAAGQLAPGAVFCLKGSGAHGQNT